MNKDRRHKASRHNIMAEFTPPPPPEYVAPWVMWLPRVAHIEGVRYLGYVALWVMWLPRGNGGILGYVAPWVMWLPRVGRTYRHSYRQTDIIKPSVRIADRPWLPRRK